ncbi:hypothetical protein [Aquabacterium humicola]|uniref:hypothetical protein n=1 Tax=Aquabacterium humicola TaxID=3237377 RepID=UPI0025439FFF|nr:hypothetical protein [Rubrivivax pictus]
MEQAQLSDVQLANLTLLLTIRDAIQQDQVAACARFGLTREQAERLIAMCVQHVMAVVANVGNVSLFPPRRDLVSLLERPLPLSGPLAVVQAPVPLTA